MILWVVSCGGLSGMDHDILKILRDKQIKVWLIVNFVDDPSKDAEAAEMYSLGISDVFFVSALNRRNINLLRDKIIEYFSGDGIARLSETPPLKISLIGKPNAGKSSLFNRLLAKDLALVSAIPGTTRDSLSEIFQFRKKPVQIVDTAGLRKRKAVKDPIEIFSASRAKKAIAESHVILTIIDPFEGFDKQTKTIIDLMKKETRPMILCVNKSDLLKKDPESRKKLDYNLKALHELFWKFPVFYISAVDGSKVTKVIEKAFELHEKSTQKVSTADLNRILKSIKNNPIIGNHQIHLNYITQAWPRLEFIIFGNRADIPLNIVRYLTSSIARQINWQDLPVNIKIRIKH